MASIIKNQLVKHLSKFTRNLKPEQISVDVLKGNSKLQFIELNEEVLTDILELPTWLCIKRAYCTGVTIDVPWTRLKTSPIQLFIDEINVDVELCSGSQKKRESPFGNPGEGASYGFANKVVENMTLYINTVEINFDSDAFGGSFMLSRLSVESRSPGWMKVNDLRQTRITCPTLNRTLMFKEVSWHLMRVEASAKSSKDEKRSKINAPLRLITSGGKVRIALKKSSIDGSVVHARIQTLLDEILWVATLPQLRSAISFSSYIMGLVKMAQKFPTEETLPQARQHSLELPFSASTSNNFKQFYFDQTSYHLHVKKIDLHLCDDAHATNSYPPGWDIENGAMQVTLIQLLIDVYPKTLANSDRTTWMRYNASNNIRYWMHARLTEQLQKLLSETKDETSRTRLERCWPTLVGFHLVVRVYDLVIQGVSDMNTKKDALKNLFVSERYVRALPSEQFIVHFEVANYVHPMSDTLPVPKPAIFTHLGPFSLTFDERTLRWCLYVANNLTTAIEDGNLKVDIDPAAEKPDILIELVMPKVVIPLPPTDSDARLPHRIVISTSMLSISSCRFETGQHIPLRLLSTKPVEQAEMLYGKEKFIQDLLDVHQEYLPMGSMRFFLQSSPIWVDTDHGEQTRGLPLVNDVSFNGCILVNADNVSLYVEPTNELNVIIDHFQFLQLTRFSVTLSEYLEILSSDQKHFSGTKPTTAPVVFAFLVALDKVRAHVFLTAGAVPSPYDSCPAITDVNNSFMERLSETTLNTRCNTPKRPEPTTAPSKAPAVKKDFIEAFPEFPLPARNLDVSLADDAASVTTSVEDEMNYEYEVSVIDEPFDIPDLAEEAILIDEKALNDRIFKSTMAKIGNVVIISLNLTNVVGNAYNGDFRVHGTVKDVDVTYKLEVLRQETNDMLKTPSKPQEESSLLPSPNVVEFKLNAPAKSKVSSLEVNVQKLQTELDDEILTHLSAFALDDQSTENNLRLKVNVKDSKIQIKEHKKKKPMVLKITECTIEQEED